MRASQPFPAARKDVKEAAAWLRSLDWIYTGMVSGHHCFEHPKWGRMDLPGTPSDRNWQDAKRRDIAQAMGISKRELEVRLGMKERKRQGPKVKRARNEAGVAARKFKAVQKVAPAKKNGSDPELSPDELKTKLADQIKEATGRLSYLPEGTWLYRDALRELHCLRAEYLETEGQPA